MFGACSLSGYTLPYNFPKTKMKNVTCVYCGSHFVVRELSSVPGYYVPVLLECGHSVCYGCAELDHNKFCPLCQLPVQVDKKSSKVYPFHIYALGLAVIGGRQLIREKEPDFSFNQTMPSQLQQIQTQGICYECEVEATLRCTECNVLYCQACYSKIHGKALKKHTKLRLTETIKDVLLAVVNTCSDVCNESICYFCKDCQTRSCAHCMLNFHSKHNYIALREKNKELMESFYEAYSDANKSLKVVQQNQKKLKTIQIPRMEITKQDIAEASVTEHFAHLHGILQNIEEKMIDKIRERQTNFVKHLRELEMQLLSQQERLEAILSIATYTKKNLDKIDVKEVVCKLKEMKDIPCHLVEEKSVSGDEIRFEADRSIIDALEKHCTLHVPPIPGFNLLRTELSSKNYKKESPTHEITIPICSSNTSSELCSSLRRSTSTISLASSKVDRTFQTDPVELVKVMNVLDPSCFYVQFWSNQKQAEELSNSLRTYSVNASPPSKKITAGNMYVVKYTRENVWRRGRVTKVNAHTNTYDVFYVDSGYLERNVAAASFREISSHLATVPILAIKCSLHDVVPNGTRWSKAATEEFRKLAEMHSPISMHIFNTHGNMHYVDLCFNPNDSPGDVISMRDALVLMEYGNYVSLQKLMRMNPLSVQRYFPEELEMEIWIEVIVQLVESPDCIYVTKIGENEEYMNELTKDMSAFYEQNASLNSLVCPIEIGIPCALQYNNGSWYRGMITQILNENVVHVLCVDFGHTLTIESQDLRRLPISYMRGRTQAIQIALKDLKPLANEKGKWNYRTIEYVKKRLTNQKVQVIAVSKQANVYCTYLYNTGNDNFNNLLVSNNFAEAIGVTSSIVPNKHRSKRKKNFKKDRSLPYTMEEDNKTTSPSQTMDTDPFKVSVQVHQARSPDCIYVSEISREKDNLKLLSKIQKFYTKYHSEEKIQWSVDSVCIVYSKKDKSYCRARILKILSEKEVLVLFYDLAIEEIISVDDIQPLTSTFQQTPANLFKVKLAGILPCGGSGTWPSSSCQKLNDIINENQNCQFYITKVNDTEDNAEIPVQLWIKQSRPEGPLAPTKTEISSVNKMLVEAGLALPIKGYNDKVDKILAVEFKRQLQEMQATSPANDGITEDIKWFSTSRTTLTELSDISSQEDEYSSATNISNVTLPQNVTDWTPALPIMNDNFIAIPTYLDHDGALYLHPKKKGQAMLSYIESLLSDNYEDVKIKPCDIEWKEGDICVAQYHGTKKWYRGKVKRVIDEETVDVQFVDYGNVEECTIGSLKKEVILNDIPIQCTKCIIVGLHPDTEDGKWVTKDLDKIHALLVEKKCRVSIVERKDTYLIVSITLIKPIKCDLISYLTNELGIRLSSSPINANDSKISNTTYYDDISTDSPDVVIEQYTKEDKPNPEIYEDAETMMEDVISMHHIISGSSMLIREYKDDTSNEEDYEILSLDNTETIKKEAVYSTPQIMSAENLATYIPLVIPNDIDTFKVELCCAVVPTIHYAQLAENKHLKVLNDYYKQYRLLMNDVQKNAAKQPLIKSIVLNMPCCAMFNDNMWYRCIIEECEEVKGSDKVEVTLYYVDYGNKETRQVALNECGLYTLKEEWLNVPPIAIKCKLWRVDVPSNVQFRKLVDELEKMYKMYNKYSFVKIKERHEDCLEVELYVDENCKELVYGSLIKRGFLQIKKTKED